MGRKVAASNEVWDVAPGMINGAGTKIHRTGWRLQGPAGRAGLARRQPRAWARGARGSHAGAASPQGVREDETRVLPVAPSCGGHTFPSRRAQGRVWLGSVPFLSPGGRCGPAGGRPWTAQRDPGSRQCGQRERTQSGSPHVLLPLGLAPASSDGRRGRVGSSDRGQCWEDGGQAQPSLGLLELESTVTPNLSLLSSHY